MSFSQSISGLNAASGDLDIIGNNIANSATNGFKASSASFADLFAGSKVGLGVKMQSVTQGFNDGSISNTGRGLDVAISQKGFFRLQDEAGTIYYSRNGQLQLDENSHLVNMQGLKLMGYPVTGDPAVIQTGADPVALRIPNTLMPAKATTAGNLVMNLKSTSEGMASKATLDPKDIKEYTKKVSLTVFDAQGNDHNMSIFFRKLDTPNSWQLFSQDTSVNESGKTVPAAPVEIGSLVFDNNGKLDVVTSVAAAGGANKISLTTTALPGTDAVTFSVDFIGSIQQDIESNVAAANQDGYRPGNLSGFRINNDGSITGTYSNEQQQPLGQIVLANFTNAEGLAPHGDNVWLATRSSGPELLGIAGTGNFGTLTNGALEASNVDLSKELVKMILAQRNYQSNAQSIKTQDQILSSLVNLR